MDTFLNRIQRLAKSRRFLWALVFGVCALIATPVFAQTDSFGLDYGTASMLGTQDVRISIMQIINVVLSFLGIIALLLILYAGYLWMTAGGNDEKVSQAKMIMRNAVIGLLIIFSAYAIVAFLIGRLSDATGNGQACDPSSDSTRACTVGGCLGYQTCQANGFWSGCIQQDDSCLPTAECRVVSIRPIGNNRPMNSVVRITLNYPNISGLDVADVTVVDTSSESIVPVSVSVASATSRIIEVKPQTPCPAPWGDRLCFGANTTYRITVGSGSLSCGGAVLACGSSGCSGVFSTGDFVDAEAPTVTVIDSQICLDTTITARALVDDDYGISHVTFQANGVEIGVDQNVSAPPEELATTPWNVSSDIYSAGESVTLSATAFDFDDNQSSNDHQVAIRPGHCCNGVKDEDEAGVDCGGNSCESCNPVIEWVSPRDGAPNTMVTIHGRRFGNYVENGNNRVDFTDATTQVTEARAPLGNDVNAACINVWHDKEIIAVTPGQAGDGALKVTRNDGEFDSTDGGLGNQIADFDVNDITRPGLCGVFPLTCQGGDASTNGKRCPYNPEDVGSVDCIRIDNGSTIIDNQALCAGLPAGNNGQEQRAEGLGFLYEQTDAFFASVKADGLPEIDVDQNTITGIEVPMIIANAEIGVRAKNTASDLFSNPVSFRVGVEGGSQLFPCSTNQNECTPSDTLCDPGFYCSSQCNCEQRPSCDADPETPQCSVQQSLCPNGWFCYNEALHGPDDRRRDCLCYQAQACDLDPVTPSCDITGGTLCPENYTCDPTSNCTCQPAQESPSDAAYQWSFQSGIQPGSCSSDPGVCSPDPDRCADNQVCDPTSCNCATLPSPSCTQNDSALATGAYGQSVVVAGGPLIDVTTFTWELWVQPVPLFGGTMMSRDGVVSISLLPSTGDVDENGVIDLTDVNLIANAASGGIVLPPNRALRADVNGDNAITSRDAQIVSDANLGDDVANFVRQQPRSWRVDFAGTQYDFSGLYQFTPGEWFHIALTVAPNTKPRLYVNGYVQPAAPTTVMPSIGYTAGSLYVGSQNAATGFFKGALDAVGVYKSVLSPTEILYAALRRPAPTTNLVAQWLFQNNLDDAVGQLDAVPTYTFDPVYVSGHAICELIACDGDAATPMCDPNQTLCPAGYFCYSATTAGQAGYDPNKLPCYCYPGLYCNNPTLPADDQFPACHPDNTACPDGLSCNPAAGCLCQPNEEVPDAATYHWSFTTATLGPRVVELCNRDQSCGTNDGTTIRASSPAPFNRAGTNAAGYRVSGIRPDDGLVAIDGVVTVRFTDFMYLPSIAPSGNNSTVHPNVELLDCGTVPADGKYAGCNNPRAVQARIVTTECNYQNPVAADAHCAYLEPTSLLAPNTWYMVALKANNITGQNGMKLVANDKVTGDYRWVFRTRNSTQLSRVACLDIDPTAALSYYYNQEQDYRAQPTSEDTVCVDLRPESCSTDGGVTMNYSWETGRTVNGVQPPALPYAVIADDGQSNDNLATSLARRDTTALLPPYVSVDAMCHTSYRDVPGMSRLTIDFTRPYVIERFPDCGEACLNAKIGARFSRDMNVSSVQNSMRLYACGGDPTCDILDTNNVRLIASFSTTVMLDPAELPNTFTGYVSCYDFNNDGSFDYCLVPNTYYRVVIQGGEQGAKAGDGKLLGGLNFDTDDEDNQLDAYSWIFKTKQNYGLCFPERIRVNPTNKLARYNEVIPYAASPLAAPDACSPITGQRLNSYSYNWSWDTDTTSMSIAQGTYCSGGTIADFLTSPINFLCRAEDGSTGGRVLRDSCGNFVIEAGEDCDDGNLADGDGCSSLCLNEGTTDLCGNGRLDRGEECDDGDRDTTPNNGRPDYCDARCLWTGNTNTTLEVCGNGIRERSEMCDPQGPGCAANCVFTGSVVGVSLCGDGRLDAGEECDTGELLLGGQPQSGDGCSASCLLENRSAIGICRSITTNAFIFNPFPGNAYCYDQNDCDVHGSGYVCETLSVASGNTNVGSVCGNLLVEQGEECDTGGWCVSNSGELVTDQFGNPRSCSTRSNTCGVGARCAFDFGGNCSIGNSPCQAVGSACSGIGVCDAGNCLVNGIPFVTTFCTTQNNGARCEISEYVTLGQTIVGQCLRDGCAGNCLRNGSVQETLDPPTVGAYQVAQSFDQQGITYMQATVVSGPTGEGKLQVGPLVPEGVPAIIDWWPECSEACINADIGAQFNMSMLANGGSSSINNRANVALYECGADESCSILGMAPIPASILVDQFDPQFPNDMFHLLLPATYNPIDDDGNPNTPTIPTLIPNTWYRVVVRGAVMNSGVESFNLGNLNYNDPNYVPTWITGETADLGAINDSFSWKFKTRSNPQLCQLDRVVVIPQQLTLPEGNERYRYFSQPWSAADSCSVRGQRLNAYQFNWDWEDEELTFFTNSLINGADFLTPLADGCGNGIVEPGEDCDPLYSESYCTGGSRPGAACLADSDCGAGGSCVASCVACKHTGTQPQVCGNGVVDPGEDCDDGGTAFNPSAGDYCNATCLLVGNQNYNISVCGNGIMETGEQCDTGREPNGDDRDGCTDRCTISGSIQGVNALCGDGQIGPGENCETTWCNVNTNVACINRVCPVDPTQTCVSDLALGRSPQSGDGCTGVYINASTPNDPRDYECSRYSSQTECMGQNNGQWCYWNGVACRVRPCVTENTTDEGNTNWNLSVCGNGIIENGEECDDGNGVEGICSVDGSTCTTPGGSCSAVGACDAEGYCVLGNNLKYSSPTCSTQRSRDEGVRCFVGGACVADGCSANCTNNGSRAADNRIDPYQIIETVDDITVQLSSVLEEIRAWYTVQPEIKGRGELNVLTGVGVPFRVIGHQPPHDPTGSNLQCRNVAIWATFSRELDEDTILGRCSNAQNTRCTEARDCPGFASLNPAQRGECIFDNLILEECAAGTTGAYNLCTSRPGSDDNIIGGIEYIRIQGTCNTTTNHCTFPYADAQNSPMIDSFCQTDADCVGSRVSVTSLGSCRLDQQVGDITPTKYMWIPHHSINTVSQIVALENTVNQCATNGTTFGGGANACNIGTLAHEYILCSNGGAYQAVDIAGQVNPVAANFNQYCNATLCAGSGYSGSSSCGYAVRALNPSRTAVDPSTGKAWVTYRGVTKGASGYDTSWCNNTQTEGCGAGVALFSENGRLEKFCANADLRGARGVTIDAEGNAWVGGTQSSKLFRFSGNNTSCTPMQTLTWDQTVALGNTTRRVDGGYAYGMAMGANGELWVVQRGSLVGAPSRVAYVRNPNAASPTVLVAFVPGDISGESFYGITTDPDGSAYVSTGYGGGRAYRVTPTASGLQLETLANVPSTVDVNGTATPVSRRGVGVDLFGNLWMTRVNNLNVPAGIERVEDAAVNGELTFVPHNTTLWPNPYGISGDSSGRIWAISASNGNVCRFDRNGAPSASNGAYCFRSSKTGATGSYMYSDFLGLNKALLETEITETYTCGEGFLSPNSSYQLFVRDGENGVRDSANRPLSACEEAQYQCAWNFSTNADFCTCDYIGVRVDNTSGGAETARDLFTCAGNACGQATESILDDDVDANLIGNQHRYNAQCYDIAPERPRIPLMNTGLNYTWSERDAENIIYLADPITGESINDRFYVVPGVGGNNGGTPAAKNGEAYVNVAASQRYCTGTDEMCVTDANCGGVPGSCAARATARQAIQVTNFMCDNPWPDVSHFPYRDNEDNIANFPGNNIDTNFEFYYCRDAGDPGFTDDLPRIDEDSEVVVSNVDTQSIKDIIFPFGRRVGNVNVVGSLPGYTNSCTIGGMSACQFTNHAWNNLPIFTIQTADAYDVAFSTYNNGADLTNRVETDPNLFDPRRHYNGHQITVELVDITRQTRRTIQSVTHAASGSNAPQQSRLALGQLQPGSYRLIFTWTNDWCGCNNAQCGGTLSDACDANLHLQQYAIYPAGASSDAIGVRVLKNPLRLSPETWYQTGLCGGVPTIENVCTTDADCQGIASTDLRAQWSFEEGIGNQTADRGPFNNIGTFSTPAPLWNDEGAVNQSLSYDGAASVLVNDHSSLDINQDLTISAWVYVTQDQINGGGNIVEKSCNYGMRILPDTRVTFFVLPQAQATGCVNGAGGNWTWTTSAANALQYNAWNHIVGMHDIEGGISKTALYINGTLVSQQNNLALGQLNTSEGVLRIGQHPYGLNSYGMRGRIDEVALFGRVLSEQEIGLLYQGRGSSLCELNVPIKDAPESLVLDGYQAIRDGRSVYVGATNLVPSTLFSNIYLMSYNQGAAAQSVTVFDRILDPEGVEGVWAFNTNFSNQRICEQAGVFSGTTITCGPATQASVTNWVDIGQSNADYCQRTYGVRAATGANPTACEAAKTTAGCTWSAEVGDCLGLLCEPIYCSNNFECPGNTACNADKQMVVRDAKRFGDLRDIQLDLREYRDSNSTYPLLEGGTYVASTTFSIWPSWNETLGTALGGALDADPLNRFIGCPAGDANQQEYCWNQNAQQFICPAGGLTYAYRVADGGRGYELYTNMEYEGVGQWRTAAIGNEYRLPLTQIAPPATQCQLLDFEIKGSPIVGTAVPQNCDSQGGDADQDGWCDNVDNCPASACLVASGCYNPDQRDSNGNGLGDVCDSICSGDVDNDGVCDQIDNCRTVANPDQADADTDRIGNACDPCTDIDRDGRWDVNTGVNVEGQPILCLRDNVPAGWCEGAATPTYGCVTNADCGGSICRFDSVFTAMNHPTATRGYLAPDRFGYCRDANQNPISTQPCRLPNMSYPAEVAAATRVCTDTTYCANGYADFKTYNPNQENYDNDLFGYIGDDCVALPYPPGALQYHVSGPDCTCNVDAPESKIRVSFTQQTPVNNTGRWVVKDIAGYTDACNAKQSSCQYSDYAWQHLPAFEVKTAQAFDVSLKAYNAGYSLIGSSYPGFRLTVQLVDVKNGDLVTQKTVTHPATGQNDIRESRVAMGVLNPGLYAPRIIWSNDECRCGYCGGSLTTACDSNMVLQEYAITPASGAQSTLVSPNSQVVASSTLYILPEVTVAQLGGGQGRCYGGSSNGNSCNPNGPANQCSGGICESFTLSTISCSSDTSCYGASSACVSGSGTSSCFSSVPTTKYYRINVPACWYAGAATLDVTFDGVTENARPSVQARLEVLNTTTSLSLFDLFTGVNRDNRTKNNVQVNLPGTACQQGYVDIRLTLGLNDRIKLSDATVGVCRNDAGQLCGNGVLEGVEQCELGFGCANPSSACSACRCIDTVLQCGDGFVDGATTQNQATLGTSFVTTNVTAEQCDTNPDYYCQYGWGCNSQCGCAPICGDSRIADGICVGGTNAGASCTDNNGCPGGTCRGYEQCDTQAFRSLSSTSPVEQFCAVCDLFCGEYTWYCQERANDLGGLDQKPTSYVWISNTSIQNSTTVKECSGGTNAGNVCSVAADCPGGTCINLSAGYNPIDTVAQMIAVQSEADRLNGMRSCIGDTNAENWGKGCTQDAECGVGLSCSGSANGFANSKSWAVGSIVHEYLLCTNNVDKARALDLVGMQRRGIITAQTSPAKYCEKAFGAGWTKYGTNNEPSRIATNVEDQRVWVAYRAQSVVAKFDENILTSDKGIRKVCGARGTGTLRAIAIDYNGDVWVGGTSGNRYVVQIDGSDDDAVCEKRILLDANNSNQPFRVPSYGFAMDSRGNLWAALREDNVSLSSATRFNIGDPSLFEGLTGDIAVSSDRVGPIDNIYGIGVDLNDNAWVVNNHGKNQAAAYKIDGRTLAQTRLSSLSSVYTGNDTPRARGVGITDLGPGNTAGGESAEYYGAMWIAQDQWGRNWSSAGSNLGATGFIASSSSMLGSRYGRGSGSGVSGDSDGYLWTIAHGQPDGKQVCRSRADGSGLICYASSDHPLTKGSAPKIPACRTIPWGTSDCTTGSYYPYIYSDFLGLNRSLVFRKAVHETPWSVTGKQASQRWGKLTYCSDEIPGKSVAKVEVLLAKNVRDIDNDGIISETEIESHIASNPSDYRKLNGTMVNPPTCAEYDDGINLDPGDTISEFNNAIDNRGSEIHGFTHTKLIITRQLLSLPTDTADTSGSPVQVKHVQFTCRYGKPLDKLQAGELDTAINICVPQ